MRDSKTVLAEYARTGSEAAFRELVERYLGLVHSTALRVVGGDTQLAEDVAQTVFTDLARKAANLPAGVLVGGWLHRRTVNVAAPLMRAQRRRLAREREAVQMNALQDCPDDLLSQIGPFLDRAVSELADDDRTAILLRFFERREYRGVAEALDVTEDAARMRVNRALEKLRTLLTQQGVEVTAIGLGAALGSTALAVAPAGMAASITTSALATSAAAGFLSTLVPEFMTTSKVLTTLSALIAAGLVGTMVLQYRTQLKIRAESDSLRQQITQLQADAERAKALLAVQSTVSITADQLRELLRLRGEVGVLRRQVREGQMATTEGQGNRVGASSQSAATTLATPNRAAPFQVQLVTDDPAENTEVLTNNAGGGLNQTLRVQKAPLLDYSSVRSVSVSTDDLGKPVIDVEFSDAGKELFAEITKSNLNKRLAIVLDGQVYSAPTIRSQITGGRAQVSGVFTPDEARELAARINEAISLSPGN